MFRPVLNESMPIDITFGINLQQIVDLVTKLHKFSQKTFNAKKKSNSNEILKEKLKLLWLISPLHSGWKEPIADNMHVATIGEC